MKISMPNAFKTGFKKHRLKYIKEKLRVTLDQKKSLEDQIATRNTENDNLLRTITIYDQIWNTLEGDMKVLEMLSNVDTSDDEKDKEVDGDEEKSNDMVDDPAENVLPQHDTVEFINNYILKEYDNQGTKIKIQTKWNSVKSIINKLIRAKNKLVASVKVQQLMTSMASLRSEKQALEQKLISVQSEFARSASDCDHYSSQIESNAKLLGRLKRQVVEKEKQVELLKKQLEHAKHSTSSSSSDSTLSSDEAVNLEIANLKDQLALMGEQLEGKVEDIFRLREDMNRLQSEHDEQIHSLTQRSSLEKTEPFRILKDSLSNVLREKDMLEDELSLSRSQAASASERVQHELKLYTEKLDELRSSFAKTLSSRDAEIESLSSKLASLQSQLETAGKYKDWESLIRKLTSRLESRSRKLHRLREDIKKYFSKSNDELISKLRFFEKQHKMLSHRVSELTKEKARVSSSSQEVISKELEELRSFKESTLSDTLISTLKNDLEEALALNAEYELELHDLNKYCDSLSGSKDSYQSMYDSSQKQNIEIKMELAKESNRSKKYIEEIDRLTSSLSASKDHAASLSSELQSLASSRRSLLDENLMLRRSFHHQCSVSDSQRRQQSAYLSLLEQEKAARLSVEKSLESSLSTSSTLRSESSSLSKSLDSLRADFDRQSRLLSRYSSSSSSAADQEDELDNLRKLVYCGICNINQKNVMITKCGHTFCRSCFDEFTATRARICP
eukprot:CAMPEP_0117429070 /NCGR_PEP_ID=MMETSP0758-20121206/8646_1 /TAXON_ID=63605 /ORGANISM="Percolomonas cosmopolitus, Strain AE-1 (ATCC 50343)" /LENGTH=732 /DNA_ID=CAMNT_0005215795 /DNA_START=86 /DNA_END=2281 /DNA_ORIENTATION=+